MIQCLFNTLTQLNTMQHLPLCLGVEEFIGWFCRFPDVLSIVNLCRNGNGDSGGLGSGLLDGITSAHCNIYKHI